MALLLLLLPPPSWAGSRLGLLSSRAALRQVLPGRERAGCVCT